MSCPFCMDTGCDKCCTAAGHDLYKDPLFVRYPDEWPEWKGTITPNLPPNEDSLHTPPRYGWICPACGCGNAPWASSCDNCVPHQKVRKKSYQEFKELCDLNLVPDVIEDWEYQGLDVEQEKEKLYLEAYARYLNEE